MSAVARRSSPEDGIRLDVARSAALQVAELLARAERASEPAERARLCAEARALVLAWQDEFEEGLVFVRQRNDPRADAWAEGGRRGFEQMLQAIAIVAPASAESPIQTVLVQ